MDEWPMLGRWALLDVKEIVRETYAAFLLRLEDGKKAWIPRGQMDCPDDYEEGDQNCSVWVADWLAEEKGLV